MAIAQELTAALESIAQLKDGIGAIKDDHKKTLHQFEDTNLKLKELVEKQDAEIKATGHTLASTSAELKSLTETYNAQIAEISGRTVEMAADSEAAAKRLDELEVSIKKGQRTMTAETKSHAERFCEDADFKSWHGAKGTENGTNSPRIKVGPIWGQKGESKVDDMTITGASALRSVLAANYVQEIFFTPKVRSVHMRDYMNVVSTDKQQIHFVQETGYTNNAAVAAEGSAKALSVLTFTNKTQTMQTVAHGVVISRQLARDVKVLMNHINNRLVDGIKHKEDPLLLRGDGNDTILGLSNVDNVQAFTRGVAGDTYIDNIRRAITQIDLVYLTADLCVTSVEDWEVIELQKDQEDRYIWVQPQTGAPGAPMMWRLPVFATTAQTEGSFAVGAFKTAATIWDQEEAFVQIFNQHADFALSNQLLVLGEEALTLTCEIPEGFVFGTFGAVGSGS